MIKTTIIVTEVATGHVSSQTYQDGNDAIAAKKWYLRLKTRNNTKKYRVEIEKSSK
jgi:hypothetical protein